MVQEARRRYIHYNVKETTNGKWCIHSEGFFDDMYLSKTGDILDGCSKSAQWDFKGDAIIFLELKKEGIEL